MIRISNKMKSMASRIISLSNITHIPMVVEIDKIKILYSVVNDGLLNRKVISVSIGRTIPEFEDIENIIELFGFENTIDRCVVSNESIGGDKIITISELLLLN